MAEPIPIGSATTKESNVMVMVLMIAGIMDTFSVVYSQANNFGFKYGIPLIKIYATNAINTDNVTTADNITNKNNIPESGCLRYVFKRCFQCVFVCGFILRSPFSMQKMIN